MNFETIWEEHRIPLLKFIQSKVEDGIIAEDILQEVAIKLHAQISSNSDIRNIKSWLFQVSRNSIADYFRKHEKYAKPSLVPLDNSNPSQVCVCDLSGFVIQKYLPQTFSEPLFMSDIEGKPQKEIAKELNLSLTATKSRIQRGRKKLKELIDDCIEISFNNKNQIVDFQVRADCELPPELKAEMAKINLVV